MNENAGSSYTTAFINANRVKITPKKPYVIIPQESSYKINDEVIEEGMTIIVGVNYQANITLNKLFYSEKYNSLEAIEFPINEASYFLPPLIGIDKVIKGPAHQHIINFYTDKNDELNGFFIQGLHVIMLCRYFPFQSYTNFLDKIEKSDYFLEKRHQGQFDLLYFRVSDSIEYEKLLEGKFTQLSGAFKEKLLQFNSYSPYIKGVLGLDNSYKKQLAKKYDVNPKDFTELEKPLKDIKCSIK